MNPVLIGIVLQVQCNAIRHKPGVIGKRSSLIHNNAVTQEFPDKTWLHMYNPHFNEYLYKSYETKEAIQRLAYCVSFFKE